MKRDELRRLARKEGLEVIGSKKERMTQNLARHRILGRRINNSSNKNMFTYIPDHLKTQYMCNDAIAHNVFMFQYTPDRLKTQEMCNDVVKRYVFLFNYVPDRFKTQEMCIYSVARDT